MISPVYDSLSVQFPDISFGKVDVDYMEDVAAEASISSMPTFQVYVDGEIKPNYQFS